MIWTVVWSPRAQATLARLTESGLDPKAVSDSYDRIRAALRIDADKKGEPWGPWRIYKDRPLEVVYGLDADDSLVTIMGVRREK